MHHRRQLIGDLLDYGVTQPGLTTVSQATEAKGRIAAELLLDLIAGESEPERILLETKLVVRHSVGPAHSTR